jgi:hypothetical protein
VLSRRTSIVLIAGYDGGEIRDARQHGARKSMMIIRRDAADVTRPRCPESVFVESIMKSLSRRL